MGSKMKNTMIKYWKLKEEAIDPTSEKSPLEEARDLS
jgi:hypothetical protein